MSRVTSAGEPYHLMEDAITPPARVVPSGTTLVPPQAADNSGLFLCPTVWLLGRGSGFYSVASIISRLGVELSLTKLPKIRLNTHIVTDG